MTIAPAPTRGLDPVIAWEPPGGDRGERFQHSGCLCRACQDLACQRLRDALIAVCGESLRSAGAAAHSTRHGRQGPGRPCPAPRRCADRRGRPPRHAGPDGLFPGEPLLPGPRPVPGPGHPAAGAARELRHSPIAWLFWHRPLTPEQIRRDQPNVLNSQQGHRAGWSRSRHEPATS